MSYIDGFVVPVPAANKEAYRAMSKKMTPTFKRARRHAASSSAGADDVPDGKVTDFKRAVAAQAGENVVFALDRVALQGDARQGNKAMMEDPAMKDIDMPFDGKRMIFGGFEVLLDTATQ